MKPLVFLFLLSITSLSAQQFNLIENPDLSQLADGWYKFVTDNASFDVEVINHTLNQGTITWFDGSTYSGELRGHKLHGKGTYTWANGMMYSGKLKNHMRHGKGTLVLQNKSKWYGKWKENRKHGKGKIFDAKGIVITSGTWELDVLVAKDSK